MSFGFLPSPRLPKRGLSTKQTYHPRLRKKPELWILPLLCGPGLNVADSCGEAQRVGEEAGTGHSGPGLGQIPEPLPEGSGAGLTPGTRLQPTRGRQRRLGPRRPPVPHLAARVLHEHDFGRVHFRYRDVGSLLRSPHPAVNTWVSVSWGWRGASLSSARLGVVNGARRDRRPPCTLPRSPPGPSRGEGPMTSWNCWRFSSGTAGEALGRVFHLNRRCTILGSIFPNPAWQISSLPET